MGSNVPIKTEIIGVKNSKACIPNLEDVRTNKHEIIAKIIVNVFDKPKGNKITAKNILVAISPLSLGVKEWVLGPIASLENQFGVKT